ncbi:MAG: 2-C-methyl-D-erythritol 2,4-cyclodiphosphate synthase [Candidatus Omnitrophica bacterium]|nr:2-C-methyl-D-erythritol 2,4-cyclodiphosphate synthase [Candidatus Omnitrophota bacterium]
MKIGIGFDIHRLKKGRRLFLGGVHIPYDLGLVGHSDADVLLHALCDALLGAMAKPDIGCYFSDQDPKYKDTPSINILKKVKNIMQTEKLKPVNVDCVIIADEPKINIFRNKIKIKIADVLSLNKNSIGIKAKTTEGILSFSKKGIAAYCVVLLRKVK